MFPSCASFELETNGLLVVVGTEHFHFPRDLFLDHCTGHLLYVPAFLLGFNAESFISVTNSFNTGYFPISTYRAFDNTGLRYDPTAIVTDSLFDVEKYRAYSPVYISATLCVAYAVSFAAFPAVFVHTFCEYLYLSFLELV
jgi:hypothetical protein